MKLARPALAVLALLAVGCGAQTSSTGDFEGAEKDVAQVVEDLQTAATEDEMQVVCDDLLSDALKRQAGNRCEQIADQARTDADSFGLEVDSIRVTGTTARARIEVGGGDERLELMTFVKDGDAWKIETLGEEIER